jgi:hypothetical protein
MQGVSSRAHPFVWEGLPSASQVNAVDPKRRAPVTEEQFEVQILFIFQKDGIHGMNAAAIARKLNQVPCVDSALDQKISQRAKACGCRAWDEVFCIAATGCPHSVVIKDSAI